MTPLIRMKKPIATQGLQLLLLIVIGFYEDRRLFSCILPGVSCFTLVSTPSFLSLLSNKYKSRCIPSSLCLSKGPESSNDSAAAPDDDVPAKRKQKQNPPISQQKVTTVSQLDEFFQDPKHQFRTSKGDIDYDALLSQLIVHGDTSPLGATEGPYQNFTHPVLQRLHRRRNTRSVPVKGSQPRPDDGRKIALIIEGGGMRGCVTAGMVCAIYYLGLEDAFDVIYGSSAGTIIGAYFCTRQLPWFGPEIYYDSLTTAKRKFIDPRRIMRTLGVGLLDPRLIKDVITRPAYGKPVLNLDFLLKETVQVRKPLDWEKFVQMQEVQPVRVVASGLLSEKSVTFDMARGGFTSLEEFACAAHASCLLPGIAGPVMNYDGRTTEDERGWQQEKTGGGGGGANNKKKKKNRFFVQNGVQESGVEPLADALIFEPLPYRTALKEGATDVVVLRSRPDGTDVTGKTSLFEKLIFWRFFLKKNKLPRIYKYMRTHQQKKLYAELVLELNEATRNEGDKSMMAIAVPSGSPEITRLETRREAIFDGVRRGFARAYDALVEDRNERGRGMEVARQVLPDEILNYDPLQINAGNMSAFEYYLKQKQENGQDCNLPSITGLTAEQAGLPR